MMSCRDSCQSTGLCLVPTVKLTADCLFGLLLRRGGEGMRYSLKAGR